MTREERTVFLGILTLLVYSITIYLEKGVFIFPFPLNESLFLIISCYVAYLNWKKNKLLFTLLLITSLFQFFSTEFFWTFLLDAATWEKFTANSWLDLIQCLVHILLVLCMAVNIVFSANTSNNRWFFVISVPTLYALGAFLGSPVIENIALLITAVYTYLYRQDDSSYLLWILLSFLRITTFIMLLCY